MPEASSFTVATSTGSYKVRIGAGQLANALTSADVVLVDASLASLLPSVTSCPVIPIVATEDTKTLGGCERVILECRAAGIRRGQHLLAIGGGVVQDIATFVADVYMRGLPWSYAPTTLMAMADSCIGGKSSINVGEVKNLVGGIYPPTAVLIDPLFLDSLGAAAIAAGMSEAAKIAYCRGWDCFTGYLERFERFAYAPDALISHVLKAKKWFIEVDEYDRAERRLLNFGHTFGHALESAVDHSIPHGLAVAVGMMCASAHPLAASGVETDALRAHCQHLLDMAPDVVRAGLMKFEAGVFERAFRSDKKHSAQRFALILPAAGGGVEERHLPATTESWANIARTTEQTLELLRSRAT